MEVQKSELELDQAALKRFVEQGLARQHKIVMENENRERARDEGIERCRTLGREWVTDRHTDEEEVRQIALVVARGRGSSGSLTPPQLSEALGGTAFQKYIHDSSKSVSEDDRLLCDWEACLAAEAEWERYRAIVDDTIKERLAELMSAE